MKRFNCFIILLCVVFILSLVLSACGEDKDTATKDENALEETTVVLETTADGGTVEQDSEGNVITKDEAGKVISVVDKNGNPVDVTEYLTTHTWIESEVSGGGSSSNASGSNVSGGSSNSGSGKSNDSSKASSNASSKASSGGSSASKGGSNIPSSVEGDEVEGDIPVIVATLPDDDDMIELE